MKSVLLAFAMFSRLPMPKVEWEEGNMRHLMSVFPLVGVLAGLVAAAWGWLCAFLAFGPFLRGAGFALLPLLVAGGIHVDGFCDTVDALSSHGDADKKRRILKDPHIGPFAAVALCAYLILFAALGTELDPTPATLACFGLAFVLSRALAGTAILVFPPSASSALGKRFRSAAAKRLSAAVLFGWIALAGVLMTLLGGWPGVVAFALPFAPFAWCGRMAARHFGGMSGDLSGWLVLTSEIVSLAALAVVPKIISIL